MEERHLDIEVSEVESFVNNRVWKVIVEDAMTRGLLLSEDNDMLDPLVKASQISINQGEIRALKWVVSLPTILVEEIKEIKLEEKEKKDDRSK